MASRDIDVLKFAAAAAAVSARLRRRFAEIIQNVFPQAFPGECIADHDPEPLIVPFRNRFAVFFRKFRIFSLVFQKKGNG